MLSAVERNFYHLATVCNTTLVKVKWGTDQYRQNVHKTWRHIDKLVVKLGIFKRELSYGDTEDGLLTSGSAAGILFNNFT
jgi:hypothetical protein